MKRSFLLSVVLFSLLLISSAAATDYQIYPISSCTGMGDDWWCDGQAVTYCPAASRCMTDAMNAYNQCTRRCNRTQDRVEQADCYSICQIDFQSAFFWCSYYCQ